MGHVGAQIVFVENDFHGTSAQHIRRADHERKAHFLGQPHGLVLGSRSSVRRLLQTEVAHERLEALTVLGDIDRVGGGADDRRAGFFQRPRELERSLATELHDDPLRLLLRQNLQDILQSERLEVQPVGNVVIGGNGFRITVDHDGLESVLAQLQGGMHAAVVELDSLPDAVRAASQDHDLAAVRRIRLALFLVGRVQVRRRCGELRGAGVDALVHRNDAELVPLRAHDFLRYSDQAREATVRESLALQRAQSLGGEATEAVFLHPRLLQHEILELSEEPRIDTRELRDPVDGPPCPQRVGREQQPIRARGAQLVRQLVLRILGQRQHDLFGEAVQSRLEAAQRLLQRLLEGAADRHHFTDGFHLGRQPIVGGGKLLEREARDLRDDVVDRGLKRGWRRAARDVVPQLIEGVADGELCGHLGNRKPGGFGGQRGGT